MRMINVAATLMLTFLLALGSIGCASDGEDSETNSSTEVAAPTVPSKTVEEAYSMLQDGSLGDVVVVDVRTPEEYSLGHIEDAVNVDYYAESFQDEVDRFDREPTYLVYCRCGTRGAFSVEIMQNLGFSQVYNVEGGFLEWQFQQLPSVE